jgi:hypothetical protein
VTCPSRILENPPDFPPNSSSLSRNDPALHLQTSTKVLADMKDLLLPSFEIEQILDSNYDKEEKQVLYLVQ